MGLAEHDGPEETNASFAWGKTRSYEDRREAVPTAWADMVPIYSEHEAEVPTPSAKVQFRTTESALETPTRQAKLEMKVNETEVSGSFTVPGRFTRPLIDASICCAGVAGTVWGPSVTIKTIESASSGLPWWATLTIVAGQIVGIGWLTTRALRRRR